MTLLVGFGTSKCYKASVNESETITVAKPVMRTHGAVTAGWPCVERS
jgi:hypothetical protein